MAHSITYIFPGQGSQSVGMGKEIAQTFPAAGEIFEQADQLLGFSLSGLAWNGPEDELNDTINTQPALLVHSIAVLAFIRANFPQIVPSFVAGHSMGELSALVAAGSLSFPDALLLVRKRGELMKRAGELQPGAMAAILGLDMAKLEEVCREASVPGEIVQVANDNCPGQVVISGNSTALERAIQLAQEAGARRTRTLAVSIAAHSPLMEDAQIDFNEAVDVSPINQPTVSLIGNVTALPLNSAAEIRQDLQAQLTSRVRWTETIQYLCNHGTDLFIELGNGSVLTGLLKRINGQASGLSIGTPADFDKLSF
jgi:[acyl-carrier-protein] S-malonyltransferase